MDHITRRVRRFIFLLLAAQVSLLMGARLSAAPLPAHAVLQAGEHRVSGVPYYGQIYTEDCETAALQMALAHQGIRVSQPQLLKEEHVSRAAPILGPAGIVRKWGDPSVSFVGLPNSGAAVSTYTSRSGYGTYAENIARVAKEHGGTVLWSGTGLTQAALERAVDENHPVIAWVGDRDGRMLWAPLATWVAWDGRRVVYPAPSSRVYEHTVVVAGWSGRGVYVDDPLDGARNGANVNPVVGPGWVTWQEFLAGFRTFHNMAVVLK
jgi:uncharacterized protein YvpB